jgi:integrase
MPAHPKPRWHAHAKRWCSDVGEKGANGRRATVYAPLEIGQLDPPLRSGIPRAAWEWLEVYLAKDRSVRVVAGDMSMVKLAELYLEWVERQVELKEVEPTRLTTLSVHLGRWCGAKLPGSKLTIGHVHARDLTPLMLDAVSLAWSQLYKPRYVGAMHRSARACLRWACRSIPGRDPSVILDHDPLDGATPPAAPPKANRFLDPKASLVVRRFMRWAWSRTRQLPADSYSRRFDRVFLLMQEVMGLTGCRPGELCNATWVGLRWDTPERRSGVLTIYKWKNKRKTGLDRYIYITSRVARILRLLEDYPHRHPTHIFTHRRSKGSIARGSVDALAGEPWSSGSATATKLRNLRTAAIAELGDSLPLATQGDQAFTQYLHRHTFISRGLMGGANESEIAELTGTSGEMVRRVYGHRQHSFNAALAAKLEERKRKPE